jgi:hypothetical protein
VVATATTYGTAATSHAVVLKTGRRLSRLRRFHSISTESAFGLRIGASRCRGGRLADLSQPEG